MKVKPMGTIRISLDVAPQLPSHTEADALPRAKDAVVLHVVDLKADQLTVTLKVPTAQAADSGRVADRRIPLMPVEKSEAKRS